MILLLDRVKSVAPAKAETGLPSFGQKLKLEREKRKITLEQISVSTKIGIRMLQALEEDKFNQLPGRHLQQGLRPCLFPLPWPRRRSNHRRLSASFRRRPAPFHGNPSRGEGSREDAAHESERGKMKRKCQPPGSQRRHPSSPSTLGHVRRSSARSRSGTVVLELIAVGSTRNRPVRPTPVTGREPQASGQVSGSDLPTTGSPTTGSPSLRHRPPPASPKYLPTVAPASPAATPGEFTVVIQAREESWTTITADGKTSRPNFCPPAASAWSRGRKEITVRTGNAGGVDFRFNEKKVERRR